MPSIQSVVEAISTKEMSAPDRFGNTFRSNIKIGEDWYSYGTGKRAEISIKTNGEWKQLLKGMEVEFMYDVNGDFKNIKKQSLTITNLEGGIAAAPVPQQQQSTPQAAKGAPTKPFVNAAEIGQCLNLAVQVLGLGAKECLCDKEVVKAIQWYKATREKFTVLYPTVTLEEVPKREAPPTPDYDAGLDMDDDI